MRDHLVSYFRSGDGIRSRSVSAVVLSGLVDVPAPPARLVADWQRETAVRLGMETGDVEEMPLARARTRWPDYKHCVQAVTDWTRAVGLQDVLTSSDVALMGCRGAAYHHDGAQYGGMAFCNLFLSDDRGLDVHFSSTGHRIPLVRGTVVVFDTCQPHAVIARHSSDFNVAHFPVEQDCTQVFLTWELPIENVHVAHALQIAFDIDALATLRPVEEQVRVNGTPGRVSPTTGRWVLDAV